MENAFKETKTEQRVTEGWTEGKFSDEQKLSENCSGNLYISLLSAISWEQYLANKFCISQKLTAFPMALLQVFRGKNQGLGISGMHLAILIRQNLTAGRGLCVHHWCNHCCKYNNKSLCLWWCHTWQCWAVWLWNNGSIHLYLFWEIIALFVAIAFHSIILLLKNCIGGMCLGTLVVLGSMAAGLGIITRSWRHGITSVSHSWVLLLVVLFLEEDLQPQVSCLTPIRRP